MIQFMIFSVLAGGLFMVADGNLRLPPVATATRNPVSGKKEQGIVEMLLHMLVMPVVKLISPFFVDSPI